MLLLSITDLIHKDQDTNNSRKKQQRYNLGLFFPLLFYQQNEPFVFAPYHG